MSQKFRAGFDRGTAGPDGVGAIGRAGWVKTIVLSIASIPSGLPSDQLMVWIVAADGDVTDDENILLQFDERNSLSPGENLYTASGPGLELRVKTDDRLLILNRSSSDIRLDLVYTGYGIGIRDHAYSDGRRSCTFGDYAEFNCKNSASADPVLGDGRHGWYDYPEGLLHYPHSAQTDIAEWVPRPGLPNIPVGELKFALWGRFGWQFPPS